MRSYDYIESDDYFDMAVAWFNDREYERAADYFKKAIRLNPNFIHAYIKLSESLAKLHNYPEAIQVLKRASTIDPTFDRLNFLMAKYAYKNDKLSLSLKYINQAIEISPKPLYLKSKMIILRALNE